LNDVSLKIKVILNELACKEPSSEKYESLEDLGKKLADLKPLLSKPEWASQLSRKETHLVLASFLSFSPLELNCLLGVKPNNWPQFEKHLLRANQVKDGPDLRLWHEYVGASHLPLPVLDSFKPIARKSFLENPIAHLLKLGESCQTLEAYWEWLCTQRIQRHWAIFNWAILGWCTQKLGAHPDFCVDLWQTIARHIELEKRLLPHSRDGFSRFQKGITSPTKESSPALLAGFACHFIQACRKRKSPVAEDLLNRLLASAHFGDPRISTETQGWRYFKNENPALFQDILSEFVRSDMALFFEHMVTGEAGSQRKAFWLTQLHSILKCIVVCTHSQYTHIRNKLAQVEDPTIKRSLQMVFNIKNQNSTSSQMPDAFILYFRSVVVVEFSKTGNAAYVYLREEFERYFTLDRLKQLDSTISLKTPQGLSELDRITHNNGWQTKTRFDLVKWNR
jgi:hypothetical protein